MNGGYSQGGELASKGGAFPPTPPKRNPGIDIRTVGWFLIATVLDIRPNCESNSNM